MQAAQSSEKDPLLKQKRWNVLAISGDDSLKKSGLSSSLNFQFKAKENVWGPRKLAIVLCVLLVEMCERMAFNGVVSNLVLYCTSILHFTSNTATSISLVFTGTTYLIPVFGGYMADTWSNRFNVIFGSTLIYIVGLLSLLSSSIEFETLFDDSDLVLHTNGRRILYIIGLIFVAIGTGGIKANVGPFGAQQVEDLGPDAVRVYFNWFYWFINAGSMIAITAIAYVQQNISFAWGNLIPVLSMVLAMFFLNVARRHFVFRYSEGSSLGSVFKICGQGLCRQSPLVDCKRQVFDSARREYGGDFDSSTVDGVIAILHMLPIFSFIIMFWVIYSQMNTTYFLQGERMDLSLGEDFIIPVAFLNVFNTIAVLVTIPVLDRIIYPCFSRMGRPMTYLQRIGIGFILSAASVFVAGGLEIERKKYLGFNQTVGGEEFFAANISVFAQAPQFFLEGAAEAFTSIAGYEFAYTQAPRSLQSALVGVFLATKGLGDYLSTAILAIIESATKDDPWFPDDINNGKVENVFFLFGGLMIVCFLFYLPTACWYKYQDFMADEETMSKDLEGEEEYVYRHDFEDSNTFF